MCFTFTLKTLESIVLLSGPVGLSQNEFEEMTDQKQVTERTIVFIDYSKSWAQVCAKSNRKLRCFD